MMAVSLFSLTLRPTGAGDTQGRTEAAVPGIQSSPAPMFLRRAVTHGLKPLNPFPRSSGTIVGGARRAVVGVVAGARAGEH